MWYNNAVYIKKRQAKGNVIDRLSTTFWHSVEFAADAKKHN